MTVSIYGETIRFLFQRVVKITLTNPELPPPAFEYELTNRPVSLSDSSGLPRLAEKANLSQNIII